MDKEDELKERLNYGAGLANTAIPLTWSNAVTQAMGRHPWRNGNQSSSASLGVSLGTGGLAITASASRGKGQADGQDTVWSNTKVSAGETAIVAVIGFGLNNIFGWAILILSGVVILVFGMAYGAQALGLKPFTNDPLGWRKAKESYKDGDAPAVKKPGRIARLFGRK